MKVGVRTPNLKKSVKARTTGRVKRAVKSSIDPTYGKKGIGWVKDPKKAAYNKVYNKTTVGVNPMSNSENEGNRSTIGSVFELIGLIFQLLGSLIQIVFYLGLLIFILYVVVKVLF